MVVSPRGIYIGPHKGCVAEYTCRTLWARTRRSKGAQNGKQLSASYNKSKRPARRMATRRADAYAGEETVEGDLDNIERITTCTCAMKVISGRRRPLEALYNVLSLAL